MIPPAPDLDEATGRLPGLWPGLRGSRIFLTGGTGFVGQWLLATLLHADRRFQLNLHVTLLSRAPERFLDHHPDWRGDTRLHWVRGDVRACPDPGGGFTHVVHAAADFTPALVSASPLQVFETIVEGSHRVLELARARGAGAFLLLSSGAVYGEVPAGMECIPETFAGAPDSTDPRSCYGLGKRAAENLCALYRAEHGLETKIARCFATAGPGLPRDRGYALADFIRDAAAGGPVRVLGTGQAVRSYLYAADLAVWLWAILLRGKPGAAYNVGSDEAVSLAQLAGLVAQCYPSAPEVTIENGSARGLAPNRYVPCIERARTDLGLEPWTRLHEAVRRTVNATG